MALGSTGPVERKVTFSALATYLGSVGVLAIIEAAGNLDLLAGAPGWAQVILAPAIPGLLAAAGGFFAAHTKRDDSDAIVRDSGLIN